MSQKRTIVVIGGTHSNSVFSEIYWDPKFFDFDLVNNTVHGATIGYNNIDVKLLKNLKITDIVIVNFLGEDWYVRNYDVPKNPKAHVEFWVPASDEIVKEAFEKFRDILRQTPAKVLIWDVPYKYYCECDKHEYPTYVKYQAKRNHELHQFFQEFTVFDHRRLLGYKFKDLKNLYIYKDIWVNFQFLWIKHYKEIANFFHDYIRKNLQ